MNIRGRFEDTGQDSSEDFARYQLPELEDGSRAGEGASDQMRVLHAKPGGQHSTVRATESDHL